MVTGAFQSKGALPEWQMIYEALLFGADFGTVITYAQLDEVLGRRFLDNRGPIYRARNELGDQRHRWLEPVPSVGYRIIEASEHLRVAGAHKKKARRQLGLMVRVADVTDVSALTPDQLATFDSQTKVNWLLYSALVHHERRIARIEEVLREEGKIK